MKRWIGIVLIVIGVAILGKFAYDQWYATPKALKQVEDQLKQIDAEQMKENKARLEEDDDLFDFSDARYLKIEEVHGEIDESRVIGAIAIPSVDLHLPIFIGSTHENMLQGAGTMKKGQEMGEGNYTLAGHNAFNPTILFAPIRNIEPGDTMYITDKEYIYTYEMTSNEVVMPERLDVIDDIPGKRTMTLVSCYSSDGSDRIIVYGDYVEKVPFKEADKEVISLFVDAKEKEEKTENK